MITGFEKALLALLLFVLMMGMGSTLTIQSFKEVVRHPKGLFIGFCSQFGWMPLLGFILAKTLELAPELAIGLIIVACTPGGTTSNLFTYFSRANLALSISMTVVSTVLAVAVMPILLYLYATPFTTTELQIPYGSVVSTLAIMLVPLAVGLFIRHRSENAARIVEKLGSYAGILVLVLLIASGLLRNRAMLFDTSGVMFIAAICLGLAGFGLGYVTSAALRLARASRRAVAFETGIQNSPLAFGIIVASFSGPTQTLILWLPMLYALMVLLTATLITIFLRRDSDAPIDGSGSAAHICP